MKRLVLLFLIGPLLTFSIVRAQDLDDYLSRYVGEEAQGYLQPVANVLSADLNSGWFRSAYIKKKGFQLTFTINAQMAFVPESQKTFTPRTPEFFSPQQSFEAPTIFGSRDGVQVQGTAGTAYNAPGGTDMAYLPFGIPQLTVGSVFGTDATIRYFVIDFGGDVGKVDVFGWGIRHSVSQYFDGLPLDIAVGYFSNSFEVGSYVDANSSLISAHVGYQLGVLEFYGGPGYETADVNIKYESEEVDGTVNVDLKGENDFRFTMGVGLNLGAFKIFTDYNFAKVSALNAGLGIGFNTKKETNGF